ncbi:MAG: hypothetical protein IPK16_29200 [Anaerolineales bacterium]|nr:hypothetical protein [Anaerolineales bacterium]
MDLERRVRQLMTKQGMAFEQRLPHAAFDERLAWLTDIAIRAGNRQRQSRHLLHSLVKRYLERAGANRDFLRRDGRLLEAELKE